MTDSTHQTRMPTTAVLVAYYAMLLAFLVASFFPQYRVWGINFWAYFPTYVPLVLFTLGAVFPFAVRWIPGREQTNKENKNYVWLVLGLTVLFGLAFYFLRARTHFLGDGYQILSILASDNPFLKPTEYGEALVHLWVNTIIGGNGEQAALLSYQIVSITSGVLFLILAAAASLRLFEHSVERLLFWLGLASGGYMLLFFGYVENYSLLVLMVAMYTLMGMLVTKGKLNRWLILIPLAFALFFHAIATTLIPSVVYLLLANSRAVDFTARQSPAAKIAFTIAALAIAIWVFHHLYTTEYFFRLAFLPLFENRFTVEGYTLFSIKHLADYANLLLLLLPGLPILVAVLLSSSLRKVILSKEYRFLLILTVSTLGAVFVLDPKLGMPRDWDLFSVAGVPIAILCYYLVLDNRRTVGSSYTSAAMLSIALGLLLLFPRALSQSIPNTALVHFQNYLILDKVKGKNARRVLINYFKKTDDYSSAVREQKRIIKDFPEKGLLNEAISLIDSGRPRQAVPVLRRIVRLNPTYTDAWFNLGKCHVLLGEYRKALEFMRIADGQNPYNPEIKSDLAVAHLFLGEYDRAEAILKHSLALDSTQHRAIFNLVYLYILQQEWDNYRWSLRQFLKHPAASPDDLRALAERLLNGGNPEQAAHLLETARCRGLNSNYIDSLRNRYPQLRQYLPLAPVSQDSLQQH